MINEVVKHVAIPKEWENMKMKSVYKVKGYNKEMNNQRSIFMPNILSKFLERILYARNKKNLRKGISEQQNWSMVKGSIYDNLFTLQAIIDDNINHRKDTYILFADAEKCFDGLWLSDACNELGKIGFPEEDELIRKMNSKAIVTFDTPVGFTNRITLHNIVMQGTWDQCRA